MNSSSGVLSNAATSANSLVDPHAFGMVEARGPGPGSFNEAPTSELNLAAIARIFWEWRWLISSLAAAGAAIAVVVTLLTPRMYQSVATVELNPPKVQVMEKGKDSDDSLSDSNFVGTQLALLRSRALAERIVQDLNLGGDPALVPPGVDRAAADQMAIGVVRGSLSAEILPASSIVKLSVVSRDPGLAAKIVNAAADSYINSGLERRYQASSYARNFLQRQIATVRSELEKSERELVGYAQQQGLISTGKPGEASDSSSLPGATLVALNTALAGAQTKRLAAEQQYRESLSAQPTSEVTTSTAGLRSQLAGLNAEYQQKLKTLRPEYPDMVRLKAQIDALEGSLQSEVTTIRQSRTGTLREAYQAAKSEEANLQGRVNQLSGQVLDIRGRNIRYNILQRDVDTNRTLYDALLQRYKEIGVAGGIGSANASIVDHGRVPGAPFKPNLYVNLLEGILAGLAIGVGVALMLEFVNDTVKSPDDVREKLRLAFIGGVPTARKPNALEELTEPQSGLAEGYFSIATALQYTTDSGVPQSLLITSTRPAEGKSTTAWALAQSFTKLGRTVLLIDADLRRPAFITSGGHNTVGLSLLLTNTLPLSDSVLQSELPGLWLVPSGPIPPNPPELLASPRLGALLAEAQRDFDVVIIDGPPILGLADSPLLSATIGATLVVIEAGRTRTRAAIEAINRLRSANAHVLGAILTRYRPEAAYGYGYGYGYGSKDESYSYRLDDRRRRQIPFGVSEEEPKTGNQRSPGEFG